MSDRHECSATAAGMVPARLGKYEVPSLGEDAIRRIIREELKAHGLRYDPCSSGAT